MELTVLNENLELIYALDSFNSLIWSDRYFESGDFEICMSLDLSLLSYLKTDNYLSLDTSEHTMIIEELELASDAETGNMLVVKGRSLESILDRRIVWQQTNLDGNFQTEVHRLLDENAINPTDPDRQISRLVFEESVDPLITSLDVSGQYSGEFLYDVISKLCIEKNIGFKITLNALGYFVFALYAGQDYSYDQLINPYIVFSPEFDNLLNSDYTEVKTKLKTVILVAGEGEGTARLESVINIPDGPGLDLERREMFTDASDISRTTSDVDPMTEVDYLTKLDQRGMEKLSENIMTATFDGEIIPNTMYVYGRDFFMGDIVQLINEHRLEGQVQVLEFIQTQNESGINSYPTFRKII